MIIYPPLPLSPLSPTATPYSPASPPPPPLALSKPKSKPQLHTHLHHQTYNSLLSRPLCFSITLPIALLSPSNLRTALLELNLYFAGNRSCILLRDLDDFFTLRKGCDGIFPLPPGQSPPPSTTGGSLSSQEVVEKIDRLKGLLFQWERVLPVHNPGDQEEHKLDEKGWQEWWEERTQLEFSSKNTIKEDHEMVDEDVPFVRHQRNGFPSRKELVIAESFTSRNDDTDGHDTPCIPDHRAINSEDDTDDEDTPFIPDHQRNTTIINPHEGANATDETDDDDTPFIPDNRRSTVADDTKHTVIIGIDIADQDSEISLSLEQKHRVDIYNTNKDRLRVIRSRNYHHRFRSAALESLLQQFLGLVLQKEVGLGLSGLRNENAALEHFLRRREGDCRGR